MCAFESHSLKFPSKKSTSNPLTRDHISKGVTHTSRSHDTRLQSTTTALSFPQVTERNSSLHRERSFLHFDLSAIVS